MATAQISLPRPKRALSGAALFFLFTLAATLMVAGYLYYLFMVRYEEAKAARTTSTVMQLHQP